jgi:hypothetical protein
MILQQAVKQVRARGYIVDYNPQAKTKRLLDDVQTVLAEYREYWPLSCRQIFYRLVSTVASYPKTEVFYGKLCHHLANARRASIIPFHAIRDDGVMTYGLDHYDDEDDFRRRVREMGENYKRNKLAGQDFHMEVWCEAAGMLPQISDVAEPFSVQAFSSSGFDSLTAKKRLADRICSKGKSAIILHLGHFDPSGVSIFDSVAEDVTAFVEADRPWATVSVKFERVALTAEQVRTYNLPTAPAKVTDTRSKAWEGETCQLEALPPNVIADILRKHISGHFDDAIHKREIYMEQIERRSIALALPAPGGA